jgi:DNA-directed RNA polymerase specialized sigma24 family protein
MFRFREKARLEEWTSFENEALPHLADLYRMAKWLLGNRDQAEDLVQETLLAGLRSFHVSKKAPTVVPG